jgi:DNA-binding CsgD family transcriptional regulator
VIGVYNEKKQSCVLQYHAAPLIANFEELFLLNDAISIIPNANGFALWNMSASSSPQHLQIIKIESIKSNTLLHVNTGADDVFLTVPYKNNSLRFYYKLLDYTNLSDLSYSCQLDNGAWEEQTSGIKDYENIGIGKHTFRVKVDFGNSDEFNESVVIHSLAFEILPPWYRTLWAYIVYALLFISFCVAVWYWDDRRIKLKKRQLEIKQRKQIHLKEQEISQLKTERLEIEVKHKNQELANTAINLARKNEVLTEIKDDLLKISEDMKIEEPDMPSLRRKIFRLNNKITENILQDDNLKKFEEHFDLVHSNFMEHLTKKYPELTANERKMCAFIKMNLSSKEIAPLLNISIRGVETLRYRLRKKIGLKHEGNLITFLNKF